MDTFEVAESFVSFVRDELIYLWGQLWDAYQQFLNTTWIGEPQKRWDEPGATWSGRCEGLGERIKAATALVGPVSWRDVPMTAIADGWYAWACIRLEIVADLPGPEDIVRCQRYVRDQLEVL